jgi:transposase
MAIRYKNNGRYVYETHNVWNKEKKKTETKWVYLGVVDPVTGEFAPAHTKKVEQEKLILSYGDSATLYEFSEKLGFNSLLRSVFDGDFDSVMALAFYKLFESNAMEYAEIWFEGNYSNRLFPNANLSSQRISELLERIGYERLYREFFRKYCSCLYSEHGVAIDSTGLQNEIDTPLTAFGHHGGSPENELRLLMVIDKDTSEPLYFRYFPGNIVDVSTLKNTLDEIEQYGVNTAFALIDAGYYSEDNITALYEKNIPFLTRLPINRKLFKEVAAQTSGILEVPENFVRYGKRGLYVLKTPVRFFDKERGYAYVCCDIRRKAEEITRIMFASQDDNEILNETEKKLLSAGKFVLISSKEIPTDEVLPYYYLRQSAERIFQISKTYTDILPLRVHSEKTLRGVLLLNFIAVVLYVNFRKQLPRSITPSGAFLVLKNRSCKVLASGKILPSELTKQQRIIVDSLEGMVGKFSGD